MKYLKTYNKLNEGIMDKLVGPSDNQVINSLNKLNDLEKFESIIEYGLDFNSIPRDNGWFYYPQSMHISNKNINILPNKLKIEGSLISKGGILEEIPEDLIVTKILNSSFCKISKIHKNLKVGDLNLSSNNISELPTGIIVEHNFNIRNNNISELPSDLIVNGILFIRNNPISEIPNGVNQYDYIDSIKPKGVNRIKF